MAFRLVIITEEYVVPTPESVSTNEWKQVTINEDHPTYEKVLERLNNLESPSIQCVQFYFVPSGRRI